ncbi:hypothetical protein G6F46_004250 [Rhizopus delemar]|uniref:PARP-type domain-containing protein n=3 Tax=Rhizopus TaxID=4842 RepID=I1BT50_RHIO9|nr:hypothetical protein RO3G_04085 [Rhizopus delemar RA 99-880]KAG1053954.1 hypothetical protein G6F43_004007 [Rhizopus delemar]KAG1542982.1 hypothetical protein G6F51_006954 [Rhizopus arrhizus]KAG1500614.1 hypothetical protein G6F54_003602 [Rhizopus delemar]KAG1507110.1 hypothetical protein G6F52_011714 [Rhizopus delemar]|eukprot:EIE79380.1 hypothetical protein RO3G_04085 [Rhizopus delemar RA 99-880]
MTEQKSSEGIYTYCIEYAKTQQSKCDSCKKIIPNKSLRAAEIYRKSPKEKKNLARHTWYHFKCWKVPTLLTRIPIEQFRGYPTLQDKDKARVQKVIKHGVGACWSDITKKEKEAKEEEEGEVKPKKKEIDDDVDMTESLTGVQEKKVNKTKDNKKKDKNLKAKTDEKNKVNKKNKKPAAKEVAHKSKEILLPKQDQLELESIAKEFKALKKSTK